MVKNQQKFLKTIKNLSPYIVDFNADGSMKEKKYPPDCVIGRFNQRPIIVITHDESIFSANDGKQQA